MIPVASTPESSMISGYQTNSTYGASSKLTGNVIDDAAEQVIIGVSERDAFLVRTAKAEPAAFRSLYDHYYPEIYRYAYRRTGNRSEAEDVASQTFYRAWTHLDKYEWRGVPFGVWLYRIAANLIVDSMRRRKPTASLDDALEVPDSAPNPADAVAQSERKTLLWQAVQSLPYHQRRAITLRFAGGLSNVEVAARMGRTEAAVKQLVYRGTTSLRKRLASCESLQSSIN